MLPRRWRRDLRPTAPTPVTRPSRASRRRPLPLNDEAFVNFAHASYKKVRDVAVMLIERAYGAKPDKLYFMGSSEGGREA